MTGDRELVREASVHLRRGFTLLILAGAIALVSPLIAWLGVWIGFDGLTFAPLGYVVSAVLGIVGLVSLAEGVVDHAKNAELRTRAALERLEHERRPGGQI